MIYVIMQTRDDFYDVYLFSAFTYEIKNETIDGDLATVETEIEVYNYKKIIDEANTYLTNNQSEFQN